MADEGIREIQLNGKQLVFLFMAGTVVAVVVFLLGVMVGRGVPVRAGSLSDAPPQAGLDPTAPTFPVTAAVVSDGRTPVTASETLSYPSLLEGRTPPVETLRPVSEAADGPEAPPSAPPVERPAPERASASAPRPRAAETRAAVPPSAAATTTNRAATTTSQAAPAASAAPASLAEPRGNGFVVQVAAVRQRGEATRIATRLAGKGYPAFVTTSGANFRVRVGKYGTRSEAEQVASRLEREERVEPWITR
jgi:cell division septation protein DedD